MLKKTIRRLGALAMVLAMAVSVFAVSASAVDSEQKQPTPDITKNIVKEAGVYLPEATFTFNAVADGKSTDTKYNTPTADEALKATKGVLGTIKSEPKDSDLTKTEVEVGKLTISVNKTAFKGPGTYYYKITETGSYDGMKYDSAPRTFIVMIDANGEVLSYGFINSKEDHTKDDGVFTNIYKDEGTHKGPHDLVIEKKVIGTAYDASLTYDFWVTITNVNGTKEWYNVVSSKTTTNSTKIEAGKRTKITVAKDETVTIKGLSPQDTYIVEEADYTGDAYKYEVPTATKKVGNNNATSLELTKTKVDDKAYTFKTGTETMTAENNTVTVTNKKDFATPGGVIMTIAPYALMLVVAGAFAVVFLSRRNRAE